MALMKLNDNILKNFYQNYLISNQVDQCSNNNNQDSKTEIKSGYDAYKREGGK